MTYWILLADDSSEFTLIQIERHLPVLLMFFLVCQSGEQIKHALIATYVLDYSVDEDISWRERQEENTFSTSLIERQNRKGPNLK